MPATPVPANSSLSQPLLPRRRRHASLRLRMQARAALDALLALVLVLGSLLLSHDPHTQLQIGILAAAFGLIAFLLRRNRDLVAIRAELRAGDAVFEGRGVSIAQWHAGQPLAPWSQRVAAGGDCDS